MIVFDDSDRIPSHVRYTFEVLDRVGALTAGLGAIAEVSRQFKMQGCPLFTREMWEWAGATYHEPEPEPEAR